jgi:hypothetical protein
MQSTFNGARDRLDENSQSDIHVRSVNDIADGKAHGERCTTPRNDTVIIMPPIKQYGISTTSL